MFLPVQSVVGPWHVMLGLGIATHTRIYMDYLGLIFVQ